MHTDRPTGTKPAAPPTTPPSVIDRAVPIERIVEDATIKIIKEKCLRCGNFVEFRIKRTSGNRRDVWCPKCGACFCQHLDTDTIRHPGCATPGLNRRKR
jgi:hypothetical protein